MLSKDLIYLYASVCVKAIQKKERRITLNIYREKNIATQSKWPCFRPTAPNVTCCATNRAVLLHGHHHHSCQRTCTWDWYLCWWRLVWDPLMPN